MYLKVFNDLIIFLMLNRLLFYIGTLLVLSNNNVYFKYSISNGHNNIVCIYVLK